MKRTSIFTRMQNYILFAKKEKIANIKMGGSCFLKIVLPSFEMAEEASAYLYISSGRGKNHDKRWHLQIAYFPQFRFAFQD